MVKHEQTLFSKVLLGTVKRKPLAGNSPRVDEVVESYAYYVTAGY
jgi:hypothetical protein